MDYDGAVELIKKVESVDTMPRSVIVNISALGDRINIKEYSRTEVEDIINFVESIDQKQSLETAHGAQQRSSKQKTEIPGTEPQKEKPQKRGKSRVVSGIEAAAGELGAAVSSAGRNIEEMSEKKSNEKLVLLNLSINDQISELEKISFGLDGNVFTKEQLAIVKLEVNGLSRKKINPKEGFDKELVELRDKRLKEVMGKLGLK